MKKTTIILSLFLFCMLSYNYVYSSIILKKMDSVNKNYTKSKLDRVVFNYVKRGKHNSFKITELEITEINQSYLCGMTRNGAEKKFFFGSFIPSNRNSELKEGDSVEFSTLFNVIYYCLNKTKTEDTSWSQNYETYEIKKDDVLWGIAREECFDGDASPSEILKCVDEIIDLNNIKQPKNIQPGDKIFHPTYFKSGDTKTEDTSWSQNYETYKIKEGDDLWGIASEDCFDGDASAAEIQKCVERIKKLNNMKNDSIYTDETIIIPKSKNIIPEETND